MCGFVGITSPDDCASNILFALQALQHRGQDSAGIGTIQKEEFQIVRKLGLAAQGFSDAELALLPGKIGIGHVRYPTIGSGILRDTQPFFYRQPGILMAHNGNFINIQEMIDSLTEESIHLMSKCDVEPALCIFALELMNRKKRDHDIADAVLALRATFRRARGAFSLIASLVLDGEETLVAARDPLGIRPAVWGSRNGTAVVASESVALDALDIPLCGDIQPGEAVFFQRNRPPIRHVIEQKGSTPCIFEYIYFARPDSVMNGKSVYSVRLAMGRELALAWQAKKLSAEVVIPIPDTSRPSAGALAEALNLPCREGFIKNRYTGRTFIMPSAAERLNALKLKLNPIGSEFRDKSVLVVDDSIVRGTTLQRTIQLIREQGPREVHLAIHSPPVLHPCYYGIDMSTRQELAAPHLLSLDETQGSLSAESQQKLETRMAERLGLNSLTYLPLSGLRSSFSDECCAACFDCKYPLEMPEHQRKWIENDRRASCARQGII